MFDSLTPSDWIQVVLAIIAGLTLLAPVVYWMFKMERHASTTAVTNSEIARSLESLKADNDKDHDVIHGRIDSVQLEVKGHGEKLVEHKFHIDSLLKNGG